MVSGVTNTLVFHENSAPAGEGSLRERARSARCAAARELRAVCASRELRAREAALPARCASGGRDGSGPVAAALHGEGALELEDARPLPARRRVRVGGAGLALELVANEARLDQAEIGSARVRGAAEDLG